MGDKEAKKEAIEIIYEIANILNVNLDKETIVILIQLCEYGVSPKILSHIIIQLKKEREKFLQNVSNNMENLKQGNV
ncbi:mitotic-spindle organizing protein 1, putative [Plasmodium chabaudi chabaudi]|uniref:Mitotic-spindle organizing protein 1, putative n=4 Tax=Plasmodium (Vinckeia) TaxID=418101 RepID=A0A077TUG6_PLACU|nr:mitotic-spindle organizing protein 1, putative [Plasmodium chabaudi chabaudi]XP_724538.2 mitotic-spindle organizing protein 1, putative [Plasmodium yoelii]ETB62703.1 hypothetical protein YYC_00396 [Plasmodium yoelii 17X]SCM11086.1 mitotic-spindle organizing protein 1, putative [Plasmodium chabaudi adami]CDU20199.1 mitotic-spindle organizing protein 1, putative [Plasmodium yoelii]SCM06014.1 mitotic-spindle organizing protein 1, putative [Plasmodium chabaudi chabaudi]SCM09202.1 mitotic-spind|eukprot:XP_016654719.1 mitotic-spindle organizing protein 1, putative [Plasmodium chabaudi chabaudi]